MIVYLVPSYRWTLATFLLLSGVATFALAGPLSPSYETPCLQQLHGAWTGVLPLRDLFQVRITIRERAAGSFVARIRSSRGDEEVPIWIDGTHLRFQSTELPLAFDGMLSGDGASIGGFVRHASSITRVQLPRESLSTDRTWAADWNPLDVTDRSLRFDLYVGDDGAGGVGGFFFFRDQRLPALWGYGLACHGDTVTLGEKNLSLTLTGQLDHEHDSLPMIVAGVAGTAPITFVRMPEDSVPALPDAPVAPPRAPDDRSFVERTPVRLEDGWSTARPSDVGLDANIIGAMVRAIAADEMALTHSVLVARRGKLVVEEYFYGFDHRMWHDMRSASKTIASTVIGLAIQDGKIEGVASRALSLLPRYRRYANWDPRKALITVGDLLNMNSGLDANDFDPQSVAAEGAYQSQTVEPDWVKLALGAPMVADPGARPLVYGGANPLILGGILAQTVNEPLEWYAHRLLFAPLGIEHYKFMLDPTGLLYMGGGLHLRPRDMLKYGQLYLAGGVWRGRRLLSEEWVRESWTPRGQLEQFKWDHAYGYLWWHYRYQVGEQTVDAIEARGNGGQYISVVPSLDLVVVITGGNFRNGKTRQPEAILQQFVLPAALSIESPREAVGRSH